MLQFARKRCGVSKKGRRGEEESLAKVSMKISARGRESCSRPTQKRRRLTHEDERGRLGRRGGGKPTTG